MRPSRVYCIGRINETPISPAHLLRSFAAYRSTLTTPVFWNYIGVCSIFIWTVKTIKQNSEINFSCPISHLIHRRLMQTQSSPSHRSVRVGHKRFILTMKSVCCAVTWYDISAQRDRQQCRTGRSESSWVKWNRRGQHWHGYPGLTQCDYLHLTSETQFSHLTFELTRK